MLERHGEALTFTEIRKGVQALSRLYVQKRGKTDPAKALEGQGKRAAFVLYYGALHYIAVHHLVRRTGLDGRSLRRILDLGCGAGAAGAAWAGRLPNDAAVVGVDRSGWAVKAAGWTYAAFGLRHETRRADISEVQLPGEGEGIVLGWAVSELPGGTRDYMLDRLGDALRRGASLLVVEPVAGPVAPWWGEWVEELAPFGASAREVKLSIDPPAWIAHMDKAAHLNHRTFTVRALHG
jgi:trans-aconitate methyltransferase